MVRTRFSFKIVVVGEYACGKTSILNSYVEGKFTGDYIPTLGVNVLRKEFQLEDKNIKLILWDIAGQDLFATVRSQFYDGADGIIIVYDVTRPETLEAVPKWHKEIMETAPNVVHILLIGNKIDLSRNVLTAQAEEVQSSLNLNDYIETSANTRENVEEAFTSIINSLMNPQ